MTDERRARLVEVMGLVIEDCKTDAAALDATAFTPRGVGEALGSMLAQISAVAKGVKLLAEDDRA